MTNDPKFQTNLATDVATEQAPPTVFQCLTGSTTAALFSYGAYRLTQKIATNFAAHPFQSENYIAVNISVAVRTLVTGMCALATAVFAIAALGLLGLGIQTLAQKLRGTSVG